MVNQDDAPVEELVQGARTEGFSAEAVQRVTTVAESEGILQSLTPRLVQAAQDADIEVAVLETTELAEFPADDKVSEFLADIPGAGKFLVQARKKMSFLRKSKADETPVKVFKFVGRSAVVILTGATGWVLVGGDSGDPKA